MDLMGRIAHMEVVMKNARNTALVFNLRKIQKKLNANVILDGRVICVRQQRAPSVLLDMDNVLAENVSATKGILDYFVSK